MAAPENTLNAKNWLVKSSTKILGPFLRDEVISLLTRRQITIIDEIRQPDSRWNYIRDSRHFKEIVKNLRYEDDHAKEDTMTSTATAGSITKSDTANIPEDFTLTPVTPAKQSPQAQRSSNMRDVTPTRESSSNFKPHVGAAKSFGNLQDQRLQNKMQKQNFILRSILLVIFVGSLLVIVSVYFRKDKKSDLNYDQLIASALRFKEIGLYQKSLEFYKKASAIHEVDLENQFKMAFLLINEDRQSLKGRRIIERALLKEGRSRQEVIDGNLGMALSYMMEGDLRQSEDYLQKTLGFDANSEAAKINLAVNHLKKGNYNQAIKNFEALAKVDSVRAPLVLLGKSITLIELSKRKMDKERLQNGISEIRSHIGKSHFLEKELLLLLVYMNQMLEDFTGQTEAIAFFMQEPFDATRLYSKDPKLDWRNSEWDFLERYCSDLYNSSKGAIDFKAVRAVCLIESNRDMEATKLIDEVLAQAPKQLTGLQAQAEYLKKMGRVNEAQILFQNTDYKQTPLALYVQGENCLKNKDFGCGESAYKMLLQANPGDTLAHYGLAQVAAGKNDKAQAQQEIKAGFESESNFIPLIELRDKMESQ